MQTDLQSHYRPHRLIFSASLIALLGFSTPTFAQRIEKRFPTSANPSIHVHSENGQVKVKGWPRTEVQMVAIPSSAATVMAEQKSNRVEIVTSVTRPGTPAAERTVSFEIMAPEESALSVHCDAGSIQVERIRGDVNVETVTAPTLLREIEGHIAIKTISGPVSAERSTGRIDARSVSGDLKFRDSSAPGLSAYTTSGSIFFDGLLRHGGTYTFTNYNGPIELLLSANESFELKADSVKGVVESEFPLARPQASQARYAPRLAQSLVGVSGAGEASVQVSSFGGKIKIRKR